MEAQRRVGMDETKLSNDEQAGRRLDRAWNDVYVNNDRSAFKQSLFCTGNAA